MNRYIGGFFSFYNARKSFWMPLAAGFAFCLGVPPFNSFLHPVFSAFPLIGFVACLPLFLFAMDVSLKRSILYCYLFGLSASAGQFYWIAFVVPEGLWPLVLFSVFLLTLVEGLFYLLMGMGFRFARVKFPQAYPMLFPAMWIVLEYLRTLGEISFPWNLIGYCVSCWLPLAQTASITGVFGLSYLVVLGNTLAWKFLSVFRRTEKIALGMPIFIAVCIALSLWGFFRIKPTNLDKGNSMAVSVLQGSIDQNHWGNTSLDTSFAIFDTLLAKASVDKPDIMILPESALLCYLLRQRALKDRVLGWSKKFRTPMILGALHWDMAPKNAPTPYFVYNAAFFLDTATEQFQRYYKINLVPFSEVLPFQGIFPILSRVNLGQADFKCGKDPVVYSIGTKLRAAPFICYEIIYPDFVRQRVERGANLLVNITNDGWFGKSSGAFQHALMARVRCIENGVALARSANSGISMFVDQYGRAPARTALYERTFLTKTISLERVPTIYSRLGDWPVLASCVFALISLATLAFRRKA